MKRFKSTRCLTCTLAIMLFSLTVVRANNSETNPQKQDLKKITASLYFDVNKSNEIDSVNYLEVGNLIIKARKNEDSPITITGWSDKTGSEEYNQRLSAARAATAKRYLVQEGIDGSRITYKGMGIDSRLSLKEARRATITMEIYLEPERVIESNQPATKACEQPVTSYQEQITPSTKPTESAHEEQAATSLESAICEGTTDRGRFAIRTNLLYWLAASANAGIEWNPAGTSLGVIVNGGYAPLGHDDWKRNLGGWFISPELRIYLGRTKQWFMGASFLAGGYNFNLSDEGYQGTTIAGGITGGYKIELNKYLDMDFSLGLGYGTLDFDKYYHCDECDINVIKKSNVKTNTIMPIQAGVSLIWKIR